METTCPLARSVEDEEEKDERPESNSVLDAREFVDDEDDHRRGKVGVGK